MVIAEAIESFVAESPEKLDIDIVGQAMGFGKSQDQESHARRPTAPGFFMP